MRLTDLPSWADVWAAMTATAHDALANALEGHTVASGAGRAALVLLALALMSYFIPRNLPGVDDPILTETDRNNIRTATKGM